MVNLSIWTLPIFRIISYTKLCINIVVNQALTRTEFISRIRFNSQICVKHLMLRNKIRIDTFSTRPSTLSNTPSNFSSKLCIILELKLFREISHAIRYGNENCTCSAENKNQSHKKKPRNNRRNFTATLKAFLT